MSTSILAQVNSGSTLPIAEGVIYPPKHYYKANFKNAYTFDGWQIVVKCPYCHKEHIHGACENLEDLIPTRWAHCGNGEYRLVVVGVKK